MAGMNNILRSWQKPNSSKLFFKVRLRIAGMAFTEHLQSSLLFLDFFYHQMVKLVPSL
jgi:hypothetical protein